uniref:Cytochrome b n=1 Tax=Synergus sp. 1 DYB-20230501 TaxID=3136278 RepID=A0AAU6QCH8_9HYME
MKMKTNKMMNMKNLKNMILYLPTPMNINMWWNFGSLLGVCLMIQILSGLFLSMNYTPNINMAFNSVIYITQIITPGWLMRLIHMNGASLFFMCMFMHIGRNIYFNSYFLMKTWYSGIMIFLITMMTAFLGYVLPWGQMSFWGATVITNLMSAIPFFGGDIVIWLWGGFSINNATLNRFYSSTFIMPFVILMLVLIHLMMLHTTGSNNPLGINSNMYKIPFHIYFTIKEIQGFLILFAFIMIMCSYSPYMMSDPENFNFANPMITPIHIQPEWYFLFAYAILRSIPNKLGGVIALLSSIMILFIMPIYNMNKFQSNSFLSTKSTLLLNFYQYFFLLTWIGMKPIEYPFMLIGQLLTIVYFTYFLLNPLIFNYWNNLFYNK